MRTVLEWTFYFLPPSPFSPSLTQEQIRLAFGRGLPSVIFRSLSPPPPAGSPLPSPAPLGPPPSRQSESVPSRYQFDMENRLFVCSGDREGPSQLQQSPRKSEGNRGFWTERRFCASSNTAKQVTPGEQKWRGHKLNQRVNISSPLFFTAGGAGEGKSRRVPEEAIR